MKKLLLITILMLAFQTQAQIKTTGIKVIGSMTIKLDLNQTTSTVTMTMTGPSTKWTTVGFGATSMSSNTPIDCFTYGTAVFDQHLSGGHNAAITDATQNLTLVSNTVTGTTRTVVVTRPFSTGDTNDYVFNYALATLNIIWAVGPTNNFNAEHISKGSSNVSFTVDLGVEEQTFADKLYIYPNPSSGIFNLANDRLETITAIKVYNAKAQLIKEITIESVEPTIPIELTGLATGIYFLEISGTTDRIVKKIQIK
jgi:hypothetical protein